MRIKPLTVTIYVVTLMTFWLGSYSTSQSQKKNDKSSNPYQNFTINPKIIVYNFNTDSMVAYVKIYTSELFYKNDSSEFLCHVRIQLSVYPGYSAKSFIDSTSVTFSQAKIDDDKYRYVIATLNFKRPALQQYLLKFSVTDLNRFTQTSKYLYCSSNNNQNQFSMLMVPVESDFPAFQNYITSADSFRIFYSDTMSATTFVRYFAAKKGLAAPPHSNISMERFSYIADSTFVTSLNSQTVFNFKKEGIYHFQFDTLRKSGYTIFKFNDDFPNVAYAEEMTPPLRYLTTSKEYNDIVNSKNTAEAIENFWVARTGNKESARKLISQYYGRMEKANKYFSSYTEGWRTDRGMIYMILGQPATIEIIDKKEVWTYNNIEGYNSLNFEFTKMFNPFTENDFILIRSQLYELPWYTAVNTWREGNAFGK